MWPNSDSLGSRGLGSSSGQVTVLCSWAKHFPLTVPLSTQEYKLSTGKSSWKPDKTLGDNREKVGSTIPDLPDIPAAASTKTVLITPAKQRTNVPNMFHL